MSTPTNSFTNDKIVKAGFQLSVLLFILTFSYTIFIYNKLPPLVPVFNQLPWGVQRLGERNMIFLPLVINISMFFINLVFSKFAYDKMPLVVRMLSVTSLFLGLTVIIFIFRTSILIL